MANSVSFTYDYGTYKCFDFASGNKVTYVFEWEDPADTPPKVAAVFSKKVKEVLQGWLKNEETTVRAIRKQLEIWDKKILDRKIRDQRELQDFIDMVNETMKERCEVRFTGIEGGIMPLVQKRAMADLDEAVREKLKRERWTMLFKVVGKLVIAASVVALSIVATVLTAGAAGPIVGAALAGAFSFAKDAKDAWKEYKAIQSSLEALGQLLDDHKKACTDASRWISTAEAQLYAVEADLKKKKKVLEGLAAELAAARNDLRPSGPVPNDIMQALHTVITIGPEYQEQAKIVATAEKELAEFKAMLDQVHRIFDASQINRPPPGRIKAFFAKLEPLAPWASKVASVLQSAQKLVAKYG